MEEMEQFQRELWAISESREQNRLALEERWADELIEIEKQGVNVGDAAQRGQAELARIEAREEAEEAVFQMYAKRVVNTASPQSAEPAEETKSE
eukprot:SAG31_NODE_1101_length_9905_cov_3.367122_9_plen_94_part_00